MFELLSRMFASTDYNTDLYWDSIKAIIVYFIRVVCCHGNAEQIETWTATIANTDYFSPGNRPSENDTQDEFDSTLQSMKNIMNERLENCPHQAAIAQDLKDQLMITPGPKFHFVREIEPTTTSTGIFQGTPDEWTSGVSESTAPSDNGARTPDETLAWSPGVSESTHASDNSELHDNGPRLWPPGVDELPCADDASSQDSGTPLMRSEVSVEKTNRTVDHPVELLQHRTENPAMADLRTPSDFKTPKPTSRIFSESSRNKEHLIQAGVYLNLLR